MCRRFVLVGFFLAAMVGDGIYTMSASAGDNVDVGVTERPHVVDQRKARDYQRMIQSEPAFRSKRIDKECGSIVDDMIKQQCIDSFSKK